MQIMKHWLRTAISVLLTTRVRDAWGTMCFASNQGVVVDLATQQRVTWAAVEPSFGSRFTFKNGRLPVSSLFAFFFFFSAETLTPART